MFKAFVFLILSFSCLSVNAQLKWVISDAEYGKLPKDFHVFRTKDSLEGKPFIAFYAIADLKNKNLEFTTDTTYNRRLTPAQFYEKSDQPLLVVNSSFFSFVTHQNLNLVIKDGKSVSYNVHSIPGKGKDTLTYRHTFNGAIGISKRRKADVAWVFSDSSNNFAFATQSEINSIKDSTRNISFDYIKSGKFTKTFKKWKMQTAVGGGPVLVQHGKIKITNNEELKFPGKAINDKHPRTLIGYTKDNNLIIMVVQGRSPGMSDGASLVQAAKLMADLGCEEAMNLDGGGSSCMLINGKETITPSDKGIQRAVPAVFIISNRRQ